MGEKQDIFYEVQTRWKDIHVPTLIAATSIWWFAEQLISHPLEVLRTKIQVNRKRLTIRSLKEIVHQTGFRGLYTAFWPGTIGYLPGNAIYLLTYAFAKDRLQAKYDKLHPEKKDGRQVAIVTFTAALIADVAAVSLFCPVEVVVQRLFIQDKANKKYANTYDAVRVIAKEEGFRGFYKGFGIILLNSIPASALWWTIYEHFKAVVSKQTSLYYAKKNQNKNEKIIIKKDWIAEIVGGGIAGGIVTIITNPLDVIRTRIQTQHITTSSKPDISESSSPTEHKPNVQKLHKPYRNTFHAISSIYTKEGIGAFTKGLGPRSIQYILWSSLGALGYEICIDFSTRKKNSNLIIKTKLKDY